MTLLLFYNGIPFLKKIINFILLFFGCIGSSLLRAGFLSSCSERSLLFVVVRGLLTVVASFVGKHRLQQL